MKKTNVILHAAVASALLSIAAGAQAGNMATTTRTFATENFGATQAATVAITPAATSYAVSSAGGVTVANGQTITMYLRLSGTHVFAAAPVVAAFSSLAVGAGCVAAVPTSVSWAAGATANTVAVTYTAGAACNLPVNTTVVWTPAAGAVTAVSSTLATAGGVVSIIGSMDGGAVNNAATTLPSSQDPVSAPVNIALSAQAITGAAFSSASFPLASSVAAPAGITETAKIDLGATTGVATAFSTPGATLSNVNLVSKINLGAFVFTNNAAVTPTTLAGANYALAAANAGAGVIFAGTNTTVAPGAGQSFPIGATFFVDSLANCSAVVSAVSPAVTSLTATSPVTVAASAGNQAPGTKVSQFVCMTVPAAAPFATMTPVTPTVAVALTKAVATDAPNNIAATSVYPLVYNGSQVDIHNYVPVAATGYSTFVRVANTGSISAAVNVALINSTTGAVGASGALGTLAAGAVAIYNPTQIEAITGAIASTDRPRLRITAPTTGIKVQTYVAQPSGDIANMSSAQ
ncbi:MAG: hypothetical protein Q8O37_12295 [Sulfuricellaceae bacterium]|nr:hypothetical protein [Sulfuricellaceae bacterium]